MTLKSVEGEQPTAMEESVQARIYPSGLRPPFWKQHARFWRSLVAAIVQPNRTRSLRSLLLHSSPDFVRAMAWRHYVEPLSDYRPIPLSSEGARYLQQLRQDGIVAI